MDLNKIQRGDVIRCDLGAIEGNEGGATKGERPALVIQNNVGNKHGDHVIVAIITRTNKAHIPVLVKFGREETPLKLPGVVNTAHIFTIGKGEIIGNHGSVSQELLQRVDSALRISLSL